MKKFLVFSLLVFILSNLNTSAQNSITWQRVYWNNINTPSLYSSDICQSDDGNFFIAGYLYAYPYKGYILKINAWGDSIWSRTIDSVRILCAVPSGDGGCVVSGAVYELALKSFTLKISSAGNILWKKYYVYPSIYLQIMQAEGGSYLACGLNAGVGQLLKINSNGSLNWMKSYPFIPGRRAFTALCTDYSGGYAVAGIDSNLLIANYRAFISDVDTAGNILWLKYPYVQYRTLYFNTVAKFNQGYLLSGSAYDSTAIKPNGFLMRMDAGGNMIYYRELPMCETGSNYCGDVKVTGGKFAICGYGFDTSQMSGSACSFISDTSGNYPLSASYNSFNFVSLLKVLPVSNGDFIFVGNASNISPNHAMIYAVRTDSNFYAPPIGVNINGKPVPNRFILYQNYPNPFNPSTKIRFSVPLLKGVSGMMVRLVIYDVLGREVATLVNEHLQPGMYEVEWDGTSYSSGVYYYRLLIDASTPDGVGTGPLSITKKMVLLK